MALTAYNLKQKLDAIQRYIDVYGIKLLNKISQKKHQVNFKQLTADQLSNLKQRLDIFYIKDFILANKRYPTDFEARSLAHEFSPGRLKMLEVQKGLLADLKFGPINTNASKLAKKYKVSVRVLKNEAGNLQRNIWRKRMGANPNSVKQYPLKWLVDQGDDFDNVLKNLYKGNIIKYERNKIRDLFYDAFGRKNLEGSTIKNPSYSPKKWAAMRKNWNEYNLIRNAVSKKYPEIVLELDHPLAKSTLKNIFDATPAQLTRVNPMTADLNRGFKKVLDTYYNIAATDKNLEAKKALDTIAKDLNIKVGKVSKDFSKFDYGVKPFEKLNMREAVADALTQQRNLSTELPKYTKANPELFLKAGIDLEKISTEVPKFNIANKEFNTLIQAIKKSPQACRKILNYQTGGISATCEIAINKDPVGSAQKLANLEATSGPVATVKNAAKGFLGALGRFGPAAGKFGAIAAAGAIAQPLIKQFRNDDPFTYLTDPDQQAGMLEALIEGERPKPRSEILDWSHTAGTVGATAAAVPGTGALWKARRAKGMGMPRSALGPVGKFIAGAYTPAGLLAMEPLRIAQMRREGESWGEVAKSPTLWMGPAFADTMTRMATRGMRAGSPLARGLSLGMSRPMLKTISRRFGMPGLALSLGLSGYDQYQDFKKKRGFFARDEE